MFQEEVLPGRGVVGFSPQSSVEKGFLISLSFTSTSSQEKMGFRLRLVTAFLEKQRLRTMAGI